MSIIIKDEKELFNYKWETKKCERIDGDCWCRAIFPKKKLMINYGNDELEEVYIIPSGCVDKDVAEYIVKLHNKELNNEKKR